MDRFHHPPPYLGARSICRKEYGKSRFSGTRLISQKGTEMTHIPAKVLNVHKLYNEYLVTVQVGRENYRGTFEGLQFGENKPRFGWYRYGRHRIGSATNQMGSGGDKRENDRPLRHHLSDDVRRCFPHYGGCPRPPR
jgi:hypothetical protein